MAKKPMKEMKGMKAAHAKEEKAEMAMMKKSGGRMARASGGLCSSDWMASQGSGSRPGKSK